jgi:hypothetical protein
MIPHRDEGDPTQQAPEDQIQEIERIAESAERVFHVISERIQKDIDSLALIARSMDRAVKRLEILRATMRPLPPIDPKRDDNRLCKGEIAIICALRQGSMPSLGILAERTGYAESSLRTWLPMLRRKGLVEEDRLSLMPQHE